MPVPWAYMARSAIVLASAPSPLATNAPLSHLRLSGSAPSATPASSCALSRIFPAALTTAASVPAGRARVEPVSLAEAIRVGGHDLHVERWHAELTGHQLRVALLVAVGLGGQAEHHLSGRVNAQEDRAICLVSHCSSSLARAVGAPDAPSARCGPPGRRNSAAVRRAGAPPRPDARTRGRCTSSPSCHSRPSSPHPGVVLPLLGP